MLERQPSKSTASGKSTVSHHQPTVTQDDVATEGLEGQRPIQRGLEMEVNTVRWSVRIPAAPKAVPSTNLPLAQPFGWRNILQGLEASKRCPLDKGAGAEPFKTSPRTRPARCVASNDSSVLAIPGAGGGTGEPSLRSYH